MQKRLNFPLKVPVRKKLIFLSEPIVQSVTQVHATKLKCIRSQ